MSDKAEIKVSETVKLEVPIIVGTENEKAIDIAQLRAKTGFVTLDPAFMNTASTTDLLPEPSDTAMIVDHRGPRPGFAKGALDTGPGPDAAGRGAGGRGPRSGGWGRRVQWGRCVFGLLGHWVHWGRWVHRGC